MAWRTCVFPNLAAEMARNNHTQGDIAAMLGYSQSAVSVRMAGKIEWSMKEINTLCNQYGKDYEYLFERG